MEVRSLMLEDGHYRIEVAENVVYEELNTNYYEKKFEILKAEGYLKADSFESMIWFFPCSVKHKDIQINFLLKDKHSSFIYPLKAFASLQRVSGKRPMTIKEDVTRLKKIIIQTEGLKYIKDYFIKPVITSELYRQALCLVNFLSFYNVDEVKTELINCIQYIRKPIDKSRELPLFSDVLIFNDCINKFFRQFHIESTFEYYPLYLWWTVTNIIPLRPIEFIHLKMDCLEVKSDGSLWITVPRFKMKSKVLSDTHWEHQILIDEQTYRIIKEYISQLKVRNIYSNYLIPGMQKINKRFKGGYKIKEDISTGQQLNLLIEYFYEYVVEGIYGHYQLDKITAGDTRHFAIINMFLQGFNVLTIARMAGHEEIRSPGNYYTHAKHFVNSFVYRLSQSRLEGEFESNMSNGFLGIQRERIERARIIDLTDEEKKSYRRVDYGYCKDIKQFPNNCVEDCRLCNKYYEFHPSINEWSIAIEWLESYSKDLQVKIDKTLDLMSVLSTKTYNEIYENNETEESELKFYSIQLFKYLDHKAIIDAQIMEEQYERD